MSFYTPKILSLPDSENQVDLLEETLDCATDQVSSGVCNSEQKNKIQAANELVQTACGPELMCEYLYKKNMFSSMKPTEPYTAFSEYVGLG